ncbi:MAG: NADH-quinone oxidoreductase subunit J [Elusimicrobiota bacterium]
MLSYALFTILALIALVSALGVVLMRNVVHSAVLLGLCLGMIGGLYALLGADFLFAAQVLIYVGAIAILFLFVVLLAGRRAELSERPFNEIVGAGAIAAFLAFALLSGVILQVKGALAALQASVKPDFVPTTNSIGSVMFGPYVVAIEVLGVVLLVALVGASLLAKGLMDQENGPGRGAGKDVAG